MAKINKWQQILDTQSKALGDKGTRRKKESDPFDIFPEWATSAVENSAIEKDKAINNDKDGYSTGVENYLAKKKAHKKITPVEYTDNTFVSKTPFTSPKEEQQMSEPTNMGEYNDLEAQGISYSDPVISTKSTPTSMKMGVPRPGPSTFIQTARYNPSTRRLNILYTDGKVFPYYDVSPELADEILKKKSNHSPGQALLNTIFYGHGTTKGDQISNIDEGM